jgi:hypothetical protein
MGGMGAAGQYVGVPHVFRRVLTVRENAYENTHPDWGDGGRPLLRPRGAGPTPHRGGQRAAGCATTLSVKMEQLGLSRRPQ